jgi:hypothetical protein
MQLDQAPLSWLWIGWLGPSGSLSNKLFIHSWIALKLVVLGCCRTAPSVTRRLKSARAVQTAPGCEQPLSGLCSSRAPAAAGVKLQQPVGCGQAGPRMSVQTWTPKTKSTHTLSPVLSASFCHRANKPVAWVCVAVICGCQQRIRCLS